MTIWIDDSFKCYTEASDGLRAVETDFFDGKCKCFIEGFCFVPDGETYTDEHGNVFGPQGDMIFAWADYDKLAAAQAKYERQLMEDMQADNKTLTEALAIITGGEM